MRVSASEKQRERSMSEADAVLAERDGPVTIASINRPHCRNTVEGETARKHSPTGHVARAHGMPPLREGRKGAGSVSLGTPANLSGYERKQKLPRFESSVRKF